MASSTPLYMIPIAERPHKTFFQLIHGIIALTFYVTACIIDHITQLVFVVPLRLIPSERAHALHDQGVRYTKGAFGILITFMCQAFAPTTLRVTFESEGLGAFKSEEIDELVVRDPSGRVVELRLPKKLVIIANHQIYADWWYVWCLTYFMNMHKDVLIVLKKSLKWVPLLGTGMQVFRFIFLARSWVTDKHYLVSRLAKLGRKAQVNNTPLAYIIYPEGTVVSENTRPVSKKYADKLGIPDLTHTLLPRSTGLHYSLRALAPRIPGLKLLDITVAYPGIPPMGYGQSYYTIRSIFLDRVPPPIVHMHLRLFDVSALPIGDLSGTNPAVTPPTSSGTSRPPAYSSMMNGSTPTPAKASPIEADVPEQERVMFDEWLRTLWRVKDEGLEAFYHSGGPSSIDDGTKGFLSELPAIDIPVHIRHPSDVLNMFCFFIPAVAGWAWHKARG